MQNSYTNEYAKTIAQIIGEVKKAVIGKDVMIAKVLLAILAKGHILIEDKPGVGKTTLAMAFSKALRLDCKRMQFTPDVLPADLTGFSVYQKQTGQFVFQRGALFCQLFLADEINRTSSKTQSALLEVMEEGRITVDGVTYPLPQPHTVIATQNPIGSIGTQMLPESQMDRFMFQLEMGYPDLQHEVEILRSRENANPLESIRPVADTEMLLEMQKAVACVSISPNIYHYIASLSDATRRHPAVLLGVSPRGTLALADAARGMAFMRGRSYVLADDVAAVCPDVFTHRLVMRAQSKGAGTAVQLVQEILNTVPVPRPDGGRF